jgi:hypothetical protein
MEDKRGTNAHALSLKRGSHHPVTPKLLCQHHLDIHRH